MDEKERRANNYTNVCWYLTVRDMVNKQDFIALVVVKEVKLYL